MPPFTNELPAHLRKKAAANYDCKCTSTEAEADLQSFFLRLSRMMIFFRLEVNRPDRFMFLKILQLIHKTSLF